jgi:prophage antirepressor-like protein
MNAISTFKIPAEIIADGEIRTILKDGEPWFIARDVANVLGIKNSRDAIADLDEDEKGVVLTDTLGGSQNLAIISESGFYRLVMRSRKPIAKPFQKWVTKDVLPSIRKTGSYSLGQDENSPFPDNEKLERNLLALKFAQDNLAVTEADRVRMARILFDSFGLESQYLPTYVEGKPAFPLTQLLKEHLVEMSARKVFLLLEAEGIVEKKYRDSSKRTQIVVDEKTGEKKSLPVQKEFWVVKDEKYGRNEILTQVRNSGQTQPLFYEDTFVKMMERIE